MKPVIRPWMIGAAALLSVGGIGIAAGGSAVGWWRATTQASVPMTATSSHPVHWDDTSDNIRWSDGTNDNYVPACVPTTTGDVCSWDTTSGKWIRSASGGGASGSLTYTPAASSPIASGSAGIWSNSGDGQMYYQKTDNTQTLMTPACILSPAAQQTGNINVSGTVRGDTGIVGPSISTFYGESNITLDDVNGITLSSLATVGATATTYITIDTGGVAPIQLVGTGGTGRNIYVATYNNISAAGARVMDINGGASDALYLGEASGVANHYCAMAETVTASGAIGAQTVVVWSGLGKVSQAAATANNTKIAGIAMTAAADAGTLSICKLGQALVSSDAGVVAGDILTTSGTTSGNVVTNNTAPVGAKIGRAIEAVGGTVAAEVIIDVEL